MTGFDVDDRIVQYSNPMAPRKKKERRGGAREGAGRPPTVDGYGPVRKVRLPRDIYDRVAAAAEKGEQELGDAIAGLLRGKK